MKRALLLSLCLLLAACGQRAAAPQFGLPRFEPGDYRGRWVVINYWAKWCKPCIKEIPEINELARAGRVAVLGVNYDGASGQALREQVTALGVGFPILLEDPSAELGVQRPQVLPTTLVLDPQGRLARTLVGPQTRQSLEAATGGEPSP